MSPRVRTFWTMDYETIVNCFIGCFKNYVTGERRSFCVHYLRNEWQEYLDFLEENRLNRDWHFGYNNLSFDAQISEYVLKNMARMRRMSDPDMISKELQQYAGYVIDKRNNGEFLDFPEFRLTIPCVDIFKLNHWDNKAKSASLKWIQFSMDWPNVEEMPHHFRDPINTLSELEEVLSYCWNDVDSTEAIFKYKNRKGEMQMEEQISLRTELSTLYDVKLFSASETRISKEVFLHFLSEEMKVPKKYIKDLRTPRHDVKVSEIILPMISFSTPEFKAMYYWFQDLIIDTSAGIEGLEDKPKAPKLRIWNGDCPTDYGLGGLHGCVKSGIYCSDKQRIIKSADVTSFYPMLAIKNNWHPQHIPQPIFKSTYQGFFDKRKTYPKGHFLNYLFKIVLNATYGLSKNKHSYLYDPEFTFRITINGQLQLSMLYEMILTRVPGAVPLMQNTDGLEFSIPREHEKLYQDICDEWCAMTQLQLEFVDYDKMIIGDVNNYISVWTDPKTGKQQTKCKGRFEFEDLQLHKNKSMLVVPKALYAYFIHGTKPEDFIEKHHEFFDYCIGSKLKGDWSFEEVSSKGGDVTRTKHQKLLRYYISKQGNKLLKCHPDGRKLQLTAGSRWKQMTCNQYLPQADFNDYAIDTQYYLDAVRSEITKIERGSTVLPLSSSKAAQLTLGF